MEQFSKKERHLAFLSHFELFKGCHKKEQSQKIDAFVKHFTILPLTGSIGKKALQIYRDRRWHASIDIPDAFIAATALSHKLTLFTRNVKHYREISGLKMEKPY